MCRDLCGKDVEMIGNDDDQVSNDADEQESINNEDWTRQAGFDMGQVKMCGAGLGTLIPDPVDAYRALIARKLRQAGAKLPLPTPDGSIEGAMKAGLSIALLLIEEDPTS